MAGARVQGINFADATSAASIPITFSSAVSSGSLVVGMATFSPTSTSVTSVTDNQSNTYTSFVFDDGADDQRNVVFYRKNITNGPTVVTVNLSTGAGFRIAVMDEFSGVEGTVVNSASQVHSPGSGTDALSSGNITGGSSGDMVWGAILGTGGGGGVSAGTGFTTGTSVATLINGISEFKDLASTGTTAATFTQTTGPGPWSVGGVVFAGAAGVTHYTLTADQASFTLTGQTAGLRVGPWEIVGVGTSVEVATTAHTLTLPAGVQQGDLLIAFISSRIASTTSVTLPTGGEWTRFAEQKTNNVLTTGSAVASGMAAYCYRGASDPNLTFTHPTAPSVALGRIVVYRGSYVSGYLDQSTSATTAVSTTSVSVTGITTTFANDLIVVGLCGGQEATWTAVDATNPSVASGATNTTTRPTANTWIERAEQVTTTGADTSLAIADGVRAAAGATGNITATAGTAASHVVLVGAFRPIQVLTNYTMPADQASFALTGQAVVLNTALPAAQASFVLTGQTAVLRFGRKLIAGQGSFVLTWQTATLRRSRVPLVAAQGSFTLTGQTAALRRGYVMAAASGAFALTGQTATLKRGYVLTAAQGAFALTGQTVALRKGRVPLVAAQGSFLLTGQTAVLRAVRKLTTAQGAFTLTGQAVVLAVKLPAAQASFAVNGQTVTLRYGHKLAAVQASFLLTGQAATLKRIYKMPAAQASFTLSGPAVILNYSGEGDIEMPAGVGLFALTGQTATLRYSRKGVSAQGAFALTGQTALLKRSRVTPAATGMFAFTGQSANLIYTQVSPGDYVLTAARGIFTLTGQSVELTRTTITPPAVLEAQPGRLTFGRRVSVRRW